LQKESLVILHVEFTQVHYFSIQIVVTTGWHDFLSLQSLFGKVQPPIGYVVSSSHLSSSEMTKRLSEIKFCYYGKISSLCNLGIVTTLMTLFSYYFLRLYQIILKLETVTPSLLYSGQIAVSRHEKLNS